MNIAQLPGFSAPFTPRGKAGLVPSFPRDQSIRALAFHFRTDPEKTKDFTPLPLEPVPDCPGEFFFMYAEHVATPIGEDWTGWHPSRLYATEGLLGPVCQFEGKPGVYYGYNWVENDWDMMVMWLFGCQAKIANFNVTQTNPVHPHLTRVGPGTTLRATVDRLGERLITAEIKLTEESSLEDLPMRRFLHAYMMRHFPDMSIAADGRPLVHDIVTETQSNHVIGEIIKGEGTLTFSAEAENEELDLLQPVEVLGAYSVHFSYRTSGIEVLHDYLA